MKNKVYIETYGCQMNVADTEIVKKVLSKSGYENTDNIAEADIIFMNTCSIRENAETKILHRLDHLRHYKRKNYHLVVGIIGCMAEKMRDDLINKKKIVDIVVGPDEYRRLPEFIDTAIHGGKGIGVKLSRTETYDDIKPVRDNSLLASIPIMRGCDNFCSYCVVPYTRGRERSRAYESILEEVKELSLSGYKEITLLGQNVNSYNFDNKDFADLLEACAEINRKIRIRYTTSHPKDINIKLLEVMARNENICKHIHLPVQSGSNSVLKSMAREYTVEHYLVIIEKAKKLMPNVAITTDLIAGFCTETDGDHQATINLMKTVQYDGAYMFQYSPREGTKAFKMVDDVPDKIKQKRLQEIIDTLQETSMARNSLLVGKKEKVLIEAFSKKSKDFVIGRTDTNKSVIVENNCGIKFGDLIEVEITKVTSATLFSNFIKFCE